MSESPEKLHLSSVDLVAVQRDKLRTLFPEVFTEGGRIDLDRLRRSLGELIDAGKERFGLNWPGKSDCFSTIQKPSFATLNPARTESVNFDTTNNLLIEGDNLEVLKVLQKSYLAKVKMIFIDPPYNTGNDFIYPDNFSESLDTYLRYTGQIDSAGRKYSVNTEADGRFHSKWLNMMFPRLFLARNLLREDGLMFISIDDHEVDNLRKLCSELFGEENFIANIVWQKKYTRSNDAKFFSDNHDHILVYGKSRASVRLNLLARSEEQEAAYANPDNHPKGPWKATPLQAKSGTDKNFSYTFKNGVKWNPPQGTFPRFSVESLAKMEEGGEIWFGEDGKSTPARKTFLSEAKAGVTPITIWPYDEVGHNHEAGDELKALGLGGVFDNPKPTRLIARMLELCTRSNESAIVLDFFAGSGTTAQAVLNANKADGGNRKFILVQLPEPTERQDFPTIAAITKERVRRSIKRIEDDDAETLSLGEAVKQDLGFRVFKLQNSNFKAWNTDVAKEPGALVQQLEMHVHHIVEGRSAEDLLFEILLKSGFALCTSIDSVNIAGKTVYSIEQGAMLVCLDNELTSAVIQGMADRQPVRVICLDAGFAGNDQLKTNAVQQMRARGVTKFQTV